MGVSVGSRVGVRVMVGVNVSVEVVVDVGSAVGSTTRPVVRSVKKTAAAPMTRNNVNKPKAAGKVRVNSGMRLARTGLMAELAGFALVKLVPQTTHFVAFPLTRVPQVGQVFVVVIDFSGLIC